MSSKYFVHIFYTFLCFCLCFTFHYEYECFFSFSPKRIYQNAQEIFLNMWKYKIFMSICFHFFFIVFIPWNFSVVSFRSILRTQVPKNTVVLATSHKIIDSFNFNWTLFHFANFYFWFLGSILNITCILIKTWIGWKHDNMIWFYFLWSQLYLTLIKSQNFV